MSNIVPLRYYSLTQVFNKLGELVFPDYWDDKVANFNEQYLALSQRVSIHKLSCFVSEQFLTPKIEGFNNKRYTREEIDSLEKEFLAKNNADIHEKSQLLELQKERLISRRDQCDIQGETYNKAKKTLVANGIRYINIAKGLKQILHANTIQGKIIDSRTGSDFVLPVEFWLAENSRLSFGTSRGFYENIYSYSQTFNGHANIYTGSQKYNGIIVFEIKAFDKFFAEKFGVKKKALNQGRKAKINWKEFEIESCKRLIAYKGELPKQESFATEMQTWCKENLSTDVGLSTIKKKLKPLYDFCKSN